MTGMDIRPCSGADLDALRARWPVGGMDVHGSHFADQESGFATYLGAWDSSEPWIDADGRTHAETEKSEFLAKELGTGTALVGE
jgi:hypothetical protein